MEDDQFDTSNTLVESAINKTNTFSRMMGGQPPVADPIVKDKCKRPIPTYNTNYNPDKLPPMGLSPAYSPYVFGEPLFDDRPLNIDRLPRRHTLVGSTKKPLTSWVWKLGYHIADNSAKTKRYLWVCKHCKLYNSYDIKMVTNYAEL